MNDPLIRHWHPAEHRVQLAPVARRLPVARSWTMVSACVGSAMVGALCVAMVTFNVPRVEPRDVPTEQPPACPAVVTR